MDGYRAHVTRALDFWRECRSSIPLILKAAFPLIMGLVAFAFFMHASQSNAWYATKNWAMVPITAFQGVSLVYAMLYASLTTVIVGTAIYRRELRKMEYLAINTQGHAYIEWADRILLWTIVIVLIVIFSPLLIRNGFADTDGCSLQMLHAQSYRHDSVVIGTFVAFLLADALTIRGMNLAYDECPIDDSTDCRAKMLEIRNFAKMQLWLIDVPVLVGASVSILITLNAPSLSGWDANLLHIAPGLQEAMGKARSTNLVFCSNQPLSLAEFAESAAQIFVAGIAMGYLAAHVLMSQLVFIILNFVHTRRQHVIDAPKS